MKLKASYLGTLALLALLAAAGMFAYQYRAFRNECSQRPELLSAGDLQSRLDEEAARGDELRRQIGDTRAQLDGLREGGAAGDRRAVLDLMQRCGFVMISDEPLTSAAELTKTRSRGNASDDLPAPRTGRASRQTRTESSLLERMDTSAGRMVLWRSTSMATFPGLQAFFRDLYRDHPQVVPLRWDIAADTQRTARTPAGPGGPGLRMMLLLCWKVDE